MNQTDNVEKIPISVMLALTMGAGTVGGMHRLTSTQTYHRIFRR